MVFWNWNDMLLHTFVVPSHILSLCRSLDLRIISSLMWLNVSNLCACLWGMNVENWRPEGSSSRISPFVKIKHEFTIKCQTYRVCHYCKISDFFSHSLVRSGWFYRNFHARCRNRQTTGVDETPVGRFTIHRSGLQIQLGKVEFSCFGDSACCRLVKHGLCYSLHPTNRINYFG
jgi:hypothetical protein